ncbi:hypothetical protein DRN73_02065 [Candidatus Pacearchaeota archaeon]|nr:MAG: hypothetical protein DRN73_02065 [Candidatus Pacearchaeota archaeon]
MQTKKEYLKKKIFLAPMEEINDIAFRLLCKKAGAITFTGMIHPLTKQKLFLDDKPVLQLFSTSEKGIKKFIKKYNKKVSAWDFNLGCPAKTAKKHGFGVFLHSNLNTIEKILKTMRQNTKKFLFVKLRISPYFFDIIKIAEKYCDAIIIHPRTQQQGYSGKPDLGFALKIKSISKIPVIYSGDVNEKNYKNLLKKFDAVMIGRAAIGNPNIFAKLTNQNLKKKITFKDYLKLAIKYKLPFRQIKFQAMNFTKKKKNAKKIRLKLFKAKNINEIKEILQ